MKAIISGFNWLISTIKQLFSILMSIFSTLAMVFNYLIAIVQIAINTISSFPDWLKAFGLITISISIAYILIGRDTGKSD